MADNDVLFVEYPRCGTCKKAKRWLDARGIAYVDRSIVDDNPTASELAAWHVASGLPIRRLFNTSGTLYRELGMKAKLDVGMTDDACYKLLATNGMLVKRPILVAGEHVAFGFREAEWESLLN